MRIIVLCIMLLVAPTACLSLAAERELKVGFIYVSPVGDAGWSHAHEQARQAIGLGVQVDGAQGFGDAVPGFAVEPGKEGAAHPLVRLHG